MEPLRIALSVVAMAWGGLHIRAEYRGPRYLVYIAKPLTTLIILLIAAVAPRTGPFGYQAAILAGLTFSLAGDILLMLPRDRFLAGLVSFLVAHLCYILAFASGRELDFSLWLILPFILYALGMWKVLGPHLGRLRGPAGIYTMAIIVMVWLALDRWLAMDETSGLLAFLGALLFLISDSALAINRFRGRFPNAPLVILTTYYAGQWLIALSAAD